MEASMVEKRKDRRINRTRRMLKDALLSLILDKGYDTVTIADITQRADLGRTTFYLHYKDKEDLLLESIETIADELLSQVNQSNLLSGDPAAIPSLSEMRKMNPVLLIFQHASENASLYQIILHGEGAKPAASRFRQIINMAASNFFMANIKKTDQAQLVPVDVLSNYYAAALLGLVTWWLENGMPYPPQQMAEIFRLLFFEGANQVTFIVNRS
jgi:AcrR family transcriptional regulator